MAKPKSKRRGGRPPLYQEDLHPRLVRWMIGSGKANLAEIARVIGVTKTTISNWRSKHAAFDAAFAEPPGQAVSRVEASLYQRSLGYSYNSDKLVYDEEKEAYVVTERTVKHVPPDATSMQFFLTNRNSASWKAKQSIEHSLEGSLAEQLRRAWSKAKAGAAAGDDA